MKKKIITEEDIESIWNDKKLSKKDPSELAFREHQILSQRIFSMGHTIESVIILHGLIEIELNKFWLVFVACNRRKENIAELLESRSYSDLTKIMGELSLLDEETYKNLIEFNAFRNLLSHNLYGVKQKKITKKDTKKKFEQGLNASGSITPLMLRYLYQESMKNPQAKKVSKMIRLRPRKK